MPSQASVHQLCSPSDQAKLDGIKLEGCWVRHPVARIQTLVEALEGGPIAVLLSDADASQLSVPRCSQNALGHERESATANQLIPPAVSRDRCLEHPWRMPVTWLENRCC